MFLFRRLREIRAWLKCLNNWSNSKRASKRTFKIQALSNRYIVVNAPMPRTTEQIRGITQPMTADKPTPSAFPCSKELNVCSILAVSRQPEPSTSVQSVAYKRNGPLLSPEPVP